MSVVAAIRDMLAQGLSLEQALAAAELIENREEARLARKKAKAAAEAEKEAVHKREINAARQARYRERRNAESNATRNAESNATRNAESNAEKRDVTQSNACNALRALRPPKQKERVPPTPPLQEKLNPLWIVSDETIVDGLVDVSDFNDLAKARKGNVTLFQTVVGMWNEMAANCRLIAVRDITPPRQSAIIARSEDFTKTYDFPDALEGWRKLMGLVRGSPFLRGELNGFRCDFDFATRASSFTKIMEGKYEARQAARRR